MSNEFESECHMPLLSNKPCFLFFCYYYYYYYYYYYFILFYLCIYLFYKFISKEHLNEKGTHPFLWFAVRCVLWFKLANPMLDFVTLLRLLKSWPLQASSSSSGYHQVRFVMVIFYDSSRTLSDQSITLLYSMNDPLEKGIVLNVHPLGSSVPSSSTAIPRPPSLSQCWVESSHELHDLARKDLHVASRMFTLSSNLHSAVDHINPFPFLGRQMSAGEVRWALPSSKMTPLQYRGEFSYLPKYWEWLEDILSCNTKALSDANLYEPLLASLFTYDQNTHVLQAFLECWCAAINTLDTSVGEVSISLWDLHSVGGFLVYGSFYEKVVPNSKDMSFLPLCCRHLFATFHHLNLELSGSHLVATASWVKFWFCGKSKYQKPPTRRSI